jgi:glutamine synthetase
MLAAGLDGIKKQMTIQEATEENVYLQPIYKKEDREKILPGSLAEAVNELEKDEVMKEALGTHIFERFISAKRSEWEDYRLEVTPWELDKYLPTF